MKKEDLKKIKDFLKTPKGKAALFFIFYFIFFIFVSVIFKSGNSSSTYNDSSLSFDFSLESITNNNYKFIYNVVVDDKTVSYVGNRYEDREEFTKDSLMEYYSESNNFFINNNGVWIKADNPYLYDKFYSPDNVSTLLASASYSSKTEYDSGKKVYNFIISSASINKIFEGVDLDIEGIPNEIIVNVNEDGYVNKIKFNLNSYCKVKNICINNMLIVLNYEEVG